MLRSKCNHLDQYILEGVVCGKQFGCRIFLIKAEGGRVVEHNKAFGILTRCTVWCSSEEGVCNPLDSLQVSFENSRRHRGRR